MTMTETPQIYLVTPPEIDAAFADRLSAVLDARDIACLRLDLATRDEDRVMRAGDLCREIAHRFDVPIVVSDHVALVQSLGLDGVHLTDPRLTRKLRTDWGPDPIIGAFCGTSRHDGMAAGEAGADYVAFGPAGPTPLGSGERADPELFQWWSEMIELPVVAEGALDADTIATLAQSTDFIALGEEIWSSDDPAAELARLTAAFTA
ncbi:thiamine phosphate synthase [Jannaschia rubra]|uniref:thiamine phosphate synthase n=1 Tax=Jannaschia rubra TaxID=282197 RepID=UPI0024916EB6|nr:thiamine phosphate synthase [Jannaschia rubra]